jgi:hypothetical protein
VLQALNVFVRYLDLLWAPILILLPYLNLWWMLVPNLDKSLCLPVCFRHSSDILQITLSSVFY